MLPNLHSSRRASGEDRAEVVGCSRALTPAPLWRARTRRRMERVTVSAR